jgi:hypothetical protein
MHANQRMDFYQQRQRCGRVLLMPVPIAAFLFGVLCDFLPCPRPVIRIGFFQNYVGELIAKSSKASFVI